MAWPYDTRFKNYGPLQPVPSTALNATQDAHILHLGTHFLTLANGIPTVAGGVDQWIPNANFQGWQKNVTGTAGLYVPIEKRYGVRIAAGVNSVIVKYYTATNTGPTITLARWDIKSLSPTVAPVLTPVVSTGFVGVAGVWQEYAIGPGVEDQINITERWVLIIVAGNTGALTDIIAGATVQFSRAA